MHEISQLVEEDFPHISQNLDSWWGGRNMAPMLPKLWFKDFEPTSFVIRGDDFLPIAFLVGYISQTDKTKAHVHFIGVDPKHRGQGLGASLYEAFAKRAAALGANRIEAVTSPINSLSLRFHEALGFMAQEKSGDLVVPTQASGHNDFDGIGEDRVLLVMPLDRSARALVVIDVQNAIVSEAYKRDEIVANIRAAVEKARVAGIPVVWIQHSDDEIIRGSEDWQIVSELNPLPEEMVVEKHFRSAFAETDLGRVLAQLGVGHLYLCGAETNMCVRHTSHSALELGYDITLIADAHTCTGFEWDGYVVDAARVIDEQNINLLGYQLPGRSARAVPVADIHF